MKAEVSHATTAPVVTLRGITLSARVVLASVLLMGVLVRLALAAVLGDVAEPVSGAYDQVSYDTLAQRVVEGYGFSFPTDSYPFAKANQPTAHWSFLYTLYLASVYFVFGHHPLVARLIQALLSAAVLWLTYRLGRRLFGEWVGVAAAALSAGYAYFIFFNAALMTQTFYIICVLAALEVALAITQVGTRTSPPTGEESPVPLRKNAMAQWILLGIALGAGILLRQTLLLFTPVLFGWILWQSGWRPRGAGDGEGRRRRRNAAMGVIISGAIIAAFVLPFTVRNYLAFHDFLLLNSNGGFWMYSSNHPDQGSEFNGNYVAPIPEELKGLSEPAMDRALYSRALGFIVADPQRFLLLSLSRTQDYFWLLPSEDSSTISNVSRLFSFALYLPFMLLGLWLSRGRWRACLPLYLYVAFDTALCLMSWSAPRYRLPSDAVLMPFAGLALVFLARTFQRTSGRSLSSPVSR